MPNLIFLEKVTPAEYKVFSGNGVFIGDFIQKEDGYFDWWPRMRSGYIPSYMLRALADKLDELNQPWDEDINNFFSGLSETVDWEDGQWDSEETSTTNGPT